MADVADYTQAVNVTGGSVAITGTAIVQITGTPTVSISGTPTVNVGNTPSVTISSGTVTATISGTPSINIQSQSVTLAVNLPWTSRGTKTTAGGGSDSFTTSAVDAGAQTLGIGITFVAGGLLGLKVVGVQSGVVYKQDARPAGNLGTSGWVTVPINAAADTTYTISWTGAQNAGIVVTAYSSDLAMGYPDLGQGLMGDSLPVTMASDQINSPAVQPNQFPAGIDRQVGIAPGVTVVLIAAVAGETIYLFDLHYEQSTATGTALEWQTTGGTVFHVERPDTAPVTDNTQWHGAPLGVGQGLQIKNVAGAATTACGFSASYGIM